MPIITRQRRLLSYVKDALIAPFILVLVAVFCGRWLFVIMAVGFAICLAFVGADALPTCDYRATVIICAGMYFIVFLSALLLSLGECLFTDRFDQVWVSDQVCLDISQSFAERVIAQDFRGVFDLLDGEYQARLTIEDLIAAFDDQCRRYGAPKSLAAIRELRLASPSGSSACAVTQIEMTCAPGKKCTCGTSTLTLQLHLISEGEQQYQIVALEYVPPCLASDSDDFHAGFACVPHAALDCHNAVYVFCREEVAVTRRTIGDALIKAHNGDTDRFHFCPSADADEIDAKDWDGFRIGGRDPSDRAVIRCHRGPVVNALLVRLAQAWNPGDSVMGRVREERFEQAFEIWSPYTGHEGLGDVVWQYFINTCNGVAVLPCDEVIFDAVK